MNSSLGGGTNIALKVPAHVYDATVTFYGNVLGLERLEEFCPEVVYEFGPNRLWIDPAPHLSQAEIWLEIVASDVEKAEEQLTGAGVLRCDEVEALPKGFNGFWIMSPASIVHLVAAAS